MRGSCRRGGRRLGVAGCSRHWKTIAQRTSRRVACGAFDTWRPQPATPSGGAALPLRLAVLALIRGEAEADRRRPGRVLPGRGQQFQLAGASPESILRPMPATTTQRLDTLEQQFAELQAQVLGIKPRTSDWRRTAGTFPRDAMTLAAERSGRQWRKQSPKK